MEAIDFEEFEDHIIGDVKEGADELRFVIYSNHSPSTNDVIKRDGLDYEVRSVVDVTTDDERDEGLSYDEVTLVQVDSVSNKMLAALRKHLESLTDEEKAELRKRFAGPDIPKGWVSIEDHLPMMLACDIMQGFTEYRVKYEDGREDTARVSDHNIWYYMAKDAGVTHWYNENYEHEK